MQWLTLRGALHYTVLYTTDIYTQGTKKHAVKPSIIPAQVHLQYSIGRGEGECAYRFTYVAE